MKYDTVYEFCPYTKDEVLSALHAEWGPSDSLNWLFAKVSLEDLTDIINILADMYFNDEQDESLSFFVLLSVRLASYQQACDLSHKILSVRGKQTK